MSNYILRNADPELWAAFRARAAAEGHSLRWLLLELVRRYLEYGLPGTTVLEHRQPCGCSRCASMRRAAVPGQPAP
jgi:hypothetical protein